jgi:hypothetical protein
MLKMHKSACAEVSASPGLSHAACGRTECGESVLSCEVQAAQIVCWPGRVDSHVIYVVQVG